MVPGPLDVVILCAVLVLIANMALRRRLERRIEQLNRRIERIEDALMKTR